ncbi:AAA domain-containing protein [Ureaplasma diversum]|uniref:Uncharacterized protein n=1 Tax=Ureaplasma diversum NCTC 246 TaxID=1188241 RepID=A0A084EVR5_9BACT|nr:AAA domain-containing protein [Ureaplasma diversum]KEZ22057.1 Hypothetical protein, putative DNA helicase [Ureaplasma diversum NCTC 246]
MDKLYLNILEDCGSGKYILFNSNENAKKRSKQLIEGWKGAKNSNPTVQELIQKEIDSSINSLEHSENAFSLLLNNLEVNNIFNIFAVGLERCGRSIWDRLEWKTSNPSFKKYTNFCILAQTKDLENVSLKHFSPGKEKVSFNANTVALIFDISLQDGEFSSFSLQRISFCNYNNKLQEFKELKKINELIFTCNTYMECCGRKSLLSTMRHENKKTLSNIKSIRNHKDDKEEDNINLSKNKKYIHSFSKIYDNKNNKDLHNTFLLNLSNKESLKLEIDEDTEIPITHELRNNEIYLLAGKNTDKKKSFEGYFSDILSKNNISDSLYVKCKLENNKDKPLDDLVDNLKKENEQLTKKLKDLDKENDEASQQSKKCNDDLDKEQKSKNDIHNRLSNEIYQLEIDEKIDEKQKPKKIDELKKQANKELDIIDKRIKEIESKINNINSKQKEIANERTKIVKAINAKDYKIENINNLKEWISKDKLNIFKLENLTIRAKGKNKDISIEVESYFDKEHYNNPNFIKRYPISNLSPGEKAIITRSKVSMNFLFDGDYKQPLLVPALYKPFKVDASKADSDENIKLITQKNKLNKKQEDSFKKAIYSDALFLLQGPPGTGKTQVICSLIEYYHLANKNVVLTSSTHEAIDNAFDRFAKKEPTDPNVFAYKIASGNKVRNNPYAKELIPHRYKQALSSEANLVNIKNNQKTNTDFINDLIRYRDNSNNKFVLERVFEKILTNQCNLDEVRNEYFQYNEVLGIIDEIAKIFEKYGFDKATDKSLFEKISDIKDLEKLKSSSNSESQKNDEIKARVYERLNKFNLNFDIENPVLDNNDSLLLDVLVDNQLINLFGLTTTSSTQIEHKNELIDITTDYPIEVSIMDETSKTNLYELINRALFCKKIILAGDAYQLPPTSNFSDDLYEALEKEGIMENDYEKLDKEEIAEILNFPYFEQTINTLNQENESKKYSYEFLTHQHRFPDEITRFVNILYEEKEQPLETAKNDKCFKEYSFKYFENKLNLVSTHKLSDDYFESIKNAGEIIINDDTNFDNDKLIDDGVIETEFIKDFNTQKKNEAKINQYNALVIIKSLKLILKDKKIEKLLEKDSDFAHIGIICLSRNQATLIKKLIKEIDPDIHKKYLGNKRKIVVDTIDNFQGRECEIILVDLIRTKKSINNQGRDKNIDFLNDVNRLNVAFSRTKNILIIFGSFEEYLEPRGWKNAPNSLIKYINHYKYKLDREYIDSRDIYEDESNE